MIKLFFIDILILNVAAIANFYLENTNQFIGHIPFISTIKIEAKMSSKNINQLESMLTFFINIYTYI